MQQIKSMVVRIRAALKVRTQRENESGMGAVSGGRRTRMRNFATKVYAKGVTAFLWSLYAGMAYAATSLDSSRGPFADIMCPVVNWFAALVVPIATIAFMVAAVMFLWGEEMTGLTKKWITMIIAVAAAMAGSAVVAWIAQHFGYMATCS